MRKIFELMEKREVIILDGATGTYLENLGFKGITPEIANIHSPELVKKLHSEYCESGAEIILTNTFGANRLILTKKKLENKLEDIILKGFEIALKIKERNKNILIAGDIGPTGELLSPYGSLEIEEAEKVFREIGGIFNKTEVDFLLLETFQDLEELKIGYNTLRENTSFFIIPCLTFNFKKEFRTLMGQTLENYIEWIDKNNIKIVGSNCGLSSKEMVEFVKFLKKLTEKPLWIKPNAGKPYLKEGKVEYTENSEEFSLNCLKMIEIGVKFIGGCCGTTPEYIKQIKKVLKL